MLQREVHGGKIRSLTGDAELVQDAVDVPVGRERLQTERVRRRVARHFVVESADVFARVLQLQRDAQNNYALFFPWSERTKAHELACSLLKRRACRLNKAANASPWFARATNTPNTNKRVVAVGPNPDNNHGRHFHKPETVCCICPKHGESSTTFRLPVRRMVAH